MSYDCPCRAPELSSQLGAGHFVSSRYTRIDGEECSYLSPQFKYKIFHIFIYIFINIKHILFLGEEPCG